MQDFGQDEVTVNDTGDWLSMPPPIVYSVVGCLTSQQYATCISRLDLLRHSTSLRLSTCLAQAIPHSLTIIANQEVRCNSGKSIPLH